MKLVICYAVVCSQVQVHENETVVTSLFYAYFSEFRSVFSRSVFEGLYRLSTFSYGIYA
jgi:hypothetical protein